VDVPGDATTGPGGPVETFSWPALLGSLLGLALDPCA